MKFVFALLATLLFLAGCAALETPLDDGYQIGDLVATVTQAQAQYCASSDPHQRAIALALLHRAGAPIPSRGACTDLLALIPDGEIPAVDVEAAKQDQERFTD